MKNSDWITLPVFLFGYLPKKITDLAERLETPDQTAEQIANDIAKRDGIEPGIFVQRGIPRDKMDILEMIQENPENKSQTALWFEDEDFYIVNLPYKTVLNKIHKFMLGEPVYRKLDSGTEVHYHVVSSNNEEDEDES